MFKCAFWAPLGSIFAPLGTIVALFWSLEGPLGLPGADVATERILVDFPHKKVTPEHRNDWYLTMQSSEKAEKSNVRNVAFKTSAPGLTRNSQMCDPYNKYHMFRRVQGSRLERVLSSFGVALGVP